MKMTQNSTPNKKGNRSKWRSHWKKIVSTLAAITVFCTTYALILPAITVNSDTYCGLEEHEHTENCYTLELICGLEEGAVVAPTNETHTETVTEIVTTTEVQQVLVDEGHVHSDACYKVESNLVCGQNEHAAETDEEGNVISEGHTHSAACYEEQRTLICGQEEREPVYEEKEVEVQKEVEKQIEKETSATTSESGTPHVHTEACYNKVLTCGREEHVHTDECFSNPTLDLETAAAWEKTLPKEDELTGNWAEDTLIIAKSQLGYRESSRNFKVVNGERKGYTRYGQMFGVPYGDWCAMFIQFCMHYAEVDTRLMPASPGVPSWIRNVKKMDNYFLAGEYTPNVGDIIFFDWDSKPGDDPTVRDGDHVGIVSELKTEEKTNAEGEKIEVVTGLVALEGNSKNEVRYNTYKIDDETIMGYSVIPEKPESEEELQSILDELEGLVDENEEDVQEEELDPNMIVELASFTESGVQVNFSAPLSVFPAGTLDPALNVVEILPGTPEYEEYKVQAAAQVEDEDSLMVDARFFDITIVDINGEEVHLNDESLAKVEIIFPEKEAMTAEGNVDVVHFAEEGIEVLDSEATGNAGGEAVSFDTPSFSIFGVVKVTYTVDFYYTVPRENPSEVAEDGSEEASEVEPVINEYHMPGGTTMMMSELFTKLEINRDAAAITNVEFTDESLVTFTKKNNDYLITSLKPFTTTEVLTITFSDGSEISIGVEDAISYNHDGWDLKIDSWRRLKKVIEDAIAAGETDIVVKPDSSKAYGVEGTINIPAGVKVTINFGGAEVGRAVGSGNVLWGNEEAAVTGSFFNVEGPSNGKVAGELSINAAHFTGYGIPISHNTEAGLAQTGGVGANAPVALRSELINGKGIYINSSGKVTLTNSFIKNTNGLANNGGGPIAIDTVLGYGLHNTAPIVSHAGSLTVDKTYFGFNYLYEQGDGSTNAAAIIANGDLTVNNCPDIKNSIASGGIIVHSNGTGVIKDSTIDICRVSGLHAAPIVSDSGSVLTLDNTQITRNIARYPHWDDLPQYTVPDQNEFTRFFTEMTGMSLDGGTKNRAEPWDTDEPGKYPKGGYFFGDTGRRDPDEQEAPISSVGSSSWYLEKDPFVTAGAILVDGGDVTMTGTSNLQGNLADHGAVLVINGGTFTMDDEDSKIQYNAGYHTGAVAVAGTGTFNFDDGLIKQNRTVWFGTVSITSDNHEGTQDTARFTMGTKGGSPVIEENFSLHKGGAVYINSSNTQIERGKMRNNTAAIFGGAMYIERYQEIKLEDTVITNNTASSTLKINTKGVEIARVSGGNATTWTQAWWANLGSGLGGGLWSCPTGRTEFDNREVAIYDNTATAKDSQGNLNGGQDFSIRDHGDKLTFRTDEHWLMEYGPRVGATTDNPTDPSFLPTSGKKELRFTNVDHQEGGSYKLEITGNQAPCGGGIASNGNLYLRERQTNVTVDLEFEKKWDGAATNSQAKDVAVVASITNGTKTITASPVNPVNITLTDNTTVAAAVIAANSGNKATLQFPKVSYRLDEENDKPSEVLAYEAIWEKSTAYGTNQPIALTDEWTMTITEYVKDGNKWKVASEYEGTITKKTEESEDNHSDKTETYIITYKDEYIVRASLDNKSESYDLEVDKVNASGAPLDGAKFTMRAAADASGMNSVTLLGTASNGVTAEYAANKKYSLSQNTSKVPLVPGTIYSLWEDEAPSGVARLGLDIAFKLGDDGKPQLIATDDPVRATAETRKLNLYIGDLNGNGQNDTNERTIASDEAATKYWQIYDGLVSNNIIKISDDGLKIVVKNFGKTSHQATKTWDHNIVDNNSHWWPEKITYTLHAYTADGNEAEINYNSQPRTVDRTASTGWDYTWNNLPLKDVYGNPVIYRVVEAPVNLYSTTTSYTGTSTGATSGNSSTTGAITGWQDLPSGSDWSTVRNFNNEPVRVLVNGNKAVRVNSQGKATLVDANDSTYYEETLFYATGGTDSGANYSSYVDLKAVRTYTSGRQAYTVTYYLGTGYIDYYTRALTTYNDTDTATRFVYWPKSDTFFNRHGGSYYSSSGDYYIKTNQSSSDSRVQMSTTKVTNVKLQKPVRETTGFGATETNGGTTKILNTYNAVSSADLTVYKKKATLNSNGTITETNVPLPGAVFTISPVEKNSATNRWEPKSGEGVPDPITLTTDQYGYANTDNLKVAGYYKLVETTPPDGYMYMSSDQYIILEVTKETKYGYEMYRVVVHENHTKDSVVTGGDGYVTNTNETYQACCYHYSLTIGNLEGGEELPETGGIGTTIIYICGAILVIGAGVLLVVRRKNNK